MAANVQASGARAGERRGAVGRCTGLVPHEKVKSIIRDTIAERRCQAVRSRVRERGKRAALSGGSRSGVEAWGKRAARGRLSGRGAVGRCAGLVPHERVKSVIRDTIAERRSPVVRGQAWIGGKRAERGRMSGRGAVRRCAGLCGATLSGDERGFVLSDAVRRFAVGCGSGASERRCQAVRGQAWIGGKRAARGRVSGRGAVRRCAGLC